MINLVTVTIANSFDDSTRTEIVAYHAEDVNAKNHLAGLINDFVKLETFNNERIVRVADLQVIDISTDKESSDAINSVLTTK